MLQRELTEKEIKRADIITNVLFTNMIVIFGIWIYTVISYITI